MKAVGIIAVSCVGRVSITSCYVPALLCNAYLLCGTLNLSHSIGSTSISLASMKCVLNVAVSYSIRRVDNGRNEIHYF